MHFVGARKFSELLESVLCLLIFTQLTCILGKEDWLKVRFAEFKNFSALHECVDLLRCVTLHEDLFCAGETRH